MLQLFDSLNVFSLWYLALLSIGVSELCSFSMKKSVSIVVCIWAFSIAANLVMLKFLQDTMNFLL